MFDVTLMRYEELDSDQDRGFRRGISPTRDAGPGSPARTRWPSSRSAARPGSLRAGPL